MTDRDDDRSRPLTVHAVALRPIGTPLPLGFLGLGVGTFALSALQLGWIAPEEGHVVALTALGFTVPLQLIAALYGFVARDPIAGTGMGVLTGTWAVIGTVTLTTPPGATSPALGVVLLGCAASLLVPTVSGSAKAAAAVVMGTAAVRFSLTGVAEITGGGAWEVVAGAVGLLLGVLALYAALAFELEGVLGRTVLPTLRRQQGRTAIEGELPEQLAGAASEPGVRRQL